MRPTPAQPRTPDAPLALCLAGALLLIAVGCRRDGGAGSGAIVGEPAGGPYRATLVLEPSRPRPGAETTVTIRIEDARTSRPVSDLQVVHERILHSFVISRDLGHFAHSHHEDFAPLRPQDVATAAFHYPHVFPAAGAYRIVAEFTHRNRTWVKRFDFAVGEAGAGEPSGLVPRREATAGGYRFRLSVDPDPPVAGRRTELLYRIETAAGEPVTDLAMLLGAEAHLVTWRSDGEHYGHEHPWTPEMAAMVQAMGDGAGPEAMAAMMAMAGSGKQQYSGPEVPLRHIFPEPGLYKLFVDSAPGGRRTVIDFVLRVEP